MPNGDLAEMRHSRPASGQVASGMLYGSKDLVAALKEMGIGAAPPPKSGFGFNGEISVGNLLTILAMGVTAFIAYGQFTSSITDINNKVAAANTRIDNVNSDIASRRSFVNTKLDEMTGKVEDIPLIRDQLKQTQGNVERLTKNLDDGKNERQRQIEAARDRQEETSKNVALIIQRQDSFERKLDRVLERMEGRRGDGADPFGERQKWSERQWSRPFPPALRAIYRH